VTREIVAANPLSYVADMKFFERLGERVEQSWRAADYDEQRFPEIAMEALAQEPPSEHLGTYDTLTWLLQARAIPPQHRASVQFGQPPVQVYSTERFYIEVLHWLDGTTAVHEHSFNGAFHVLAGSSIHCLHRFDEHKRYNQRLRIGQVAVEKVERLEKGATRPILAGSAMIHSLFHLDRPSVTVVIRSNLAGDTPQYSYLKPCIGHDPFYRPEPTSRQLQALEALAKVRHPELYRLIVSAYRDADSLAFVQLALGAQNCLESRQAFEDSLRAVRDRHGDLVDALIAVSVEQKRQRIIVALRAKLQSSEHRFFLALLLLFSSSEAIFALVRDWYPERRPEDVIIDWIQEIAEIADPDAPEQRVFDIDLSGSMLDVMRHMLGGRPLDEVMQLLAQEFDAQDVQAQREELGTMSEELARSLFAPVFSRAIHADI
jgi:hypothetical protein